MSTKIQYGIKLPKMNMVEFNQWVLRLKEEVEKKAKKMVEGYASVHATKLIDRMAVMDEKEYIEKYLSDKNVENISDVKNIRIIREVLSKGNKRFLKMIETNERDPEIDISFQLSVFPLEDKILIYPIFDRYELFEVLAAMPEVSSYGYWNNTERDENCSEEEWEERKKDWKKASKNGFTVSIIDRFFDLSEIDINNLVKKIPTLDNRAKDAATYIVFNEVYEKLKREEGNVNINNANTMEEFYSDENKEKINQKKEELKKKLLPTIDQETLTLSISEIYEKTV